MERAAIIGVFDYIGYSLCQSFLEKGIEVEGVHLENSAEHFFVEEKRLEVGRNANFSEKNLQDWQLSGSEELLIISFYEAFQHERSEKGSLTEKVMEMLSGIEEAQLRILLILPASALDEKNEVIEILKNWKIPTLVVHLPTIFGPWQPEESFFQQTIILMEEGGSVPDLPESEWTSDAIYIDDVTKLIFKLYEQKKEGNFLVQSGLKRHWLDCASYLLGSEVDKINSKEEKMKENKESLTILNVQENMDFIKGLILQREHFHRIKNQKS